MGITRHAVRVRLSTRIATADDRITAAGTVLWTVAYTVVERGRESTFVTEHVAEAAARRMVRNLLADRLPGTAESDVYTEELG
ncbi:Uncharacterised protein [Mycobacteroides abscessus subsp. abscessus]|uniref:hypothetical protein n=1 Tax=Mycobacteroides abscessus TaxID=36809 RepID=UPI0009A87D64|nr:hypothetical protein [Mycobacteroides abscessus]SKM37443.1 Uncharacterised protein [Mycobacteroides abscessus subsp. abscessus]